jgi:alanine-glyoxylate transaminase/serine-glyoxylate transaminase/serine-pyruvate transaminase
MGHVNAQMIMAVLGTIQSGLIATGIDHGAGALDAAATIIARA